MRIPRFILHNHVYFIILESFNSSTLTSGYADTIINHLFFQRPRPDLFFFESQPNE